MPNRLKLAVAQARTLDSTAQTLHTLESLTREAAYTGVDLILFPEAYLGGYPRNCDFGAAVGARAQYGREQYLEYFDAAVDLGDVPDGSLDDWIDRKLPLAKGLSYRGDGTREELERIAKDTGVFLVTGVVERSGGSLYCAVVYVDPKRGCVGKRRKVMPTGTERLMWAQGSPKTLRAIATEIRGVRITLAAAVCWENMMPLLRQSLYSQNVSLYLAPTADARDTWLPLMRTIGAEGRCFVLSSNQCVRRKHLPAWIEQHASRVASEPAPPLSVSNGEELPDMGSEIKLTRTHDEHEVALPVHANTEAKGAVGQMQAALEDEFVTRGGSCIIGPLGEVLAGPLWEAEDQLMSVEVNFDDCKRGRLDLDVAGSYSRNDSFKLHVEGLDISPPP